MSARWIAAGRAKREFLTRTIIQPQSRTISLRIPPRYRGVSDQHLQTRGGERWPGNDLASEMRCRGPAVQAASAPVPPRRGPPSGGLAPLPKGEASDNGSPPGALRSKPNKHRARDALGLADLRLARCRVRARRRVRTSTSLDVARRRGPRVRFGPIGVPRALGIISGSGRQEWECGLPGAEQRIRVMTRVQIPHPSFRGRR
jgi:hypothetical protein